MAISASFWMRKQFSTATRDEIFRTSRDASSIQTKYVRALVQIMLYKGNGT
jgi:hypothetical protein